MACAEIVPARSSVAQMAEVEFAAEIVFLFSRFWKFRVHSAVADQLVVAGQQSLENFVEWDGLNILLAEHVRLAGGHVELDANDACAVLATIVLFFHEEKQLVEAPRAAYRIFPDSRPAVSSTAPRQRRIRV